MSPLGNEDARAQVGTKGLSQRWHEVEYDSVEPSSFATYRSCSHALKFAKLRIEEAVKALLENSNVPANNTYYSRFRDGQRVTCESVLKIIREIL